MSTYYMNEGAFDLLDPDVVDRTAHVLAARHPEHGDVGVLVRRVPFPENRSLRELVAAHHAAEAGRCAGYAVLAERAAEHAGAPAVESAVRFRHGEVALYRAEAHLALPDGCMEIAVTAPFAARAACDGWLSDILASLRLRGAA